MQWKTLEDFLAIRDKPHSILKDDSKRKEYEQCNNMINILSMHGNGRLSRDTFGRASTQRCSDGVLLSGGATTSTSTSEHHELSNYYRCPIHMNNRTYNCAEQAYQHSKALLFKDSGIAAAIMM